MSGIIQYLSFCDWFILLSIMSLRSIYVVPCDRISFLRLHDTPSHTYIHTTFSLSFHPLMDMWVASTSWLL